MEILDLNQLRILVYVFVATLLGAAIGLEREFADKPAGLRTHMLVSGAATLLVAISNIAVQQVSLEMGDSLVRADPIRIIEAVITGISFLGAGTIILRKDSDERMVEGLTTASSILLSASIGICVALSQFILAVGVTILTLISLHIIRTIEHRKMNKHEHTID